MYSSALTGDNLQGYITNINWTADLAIEWQNFYNDAAHITYYGRSTSINYTYFPQLPEYVDLPGENCTAHGIPSNSTNVTAQCGGGGNLASHETILRALLFLPFFIQIIINI
jgi:hypothetical protein